MKSFVLGIAAATLLGGGLSVAQTTPSTAPAGPVPLTAPAHAPSGNLAAPAGTSIRPMDHDANTAAASGNNNQAVATTSANALMPAKGSNSFTMNEAKGRIEKNGFSNVSGLTKDGNGVWHGSAQKSGVSTMVWLDYKGNVGESR